MVLVAIVFVLVVLDTSRGKQYCYPGSPKKAEDCDNKT